MPIRRPSLHKRLGRANSCQRTKSDTWLEVRGPEHVLVATNLRQLTDAAPGENRLLLKSMGRKRQLAFDLRYRGRGGYRPGAGRPKKLGAGVPHVRRPALAARHPIHVTVRVRDEAARLRSRACFRLIFRAIGAGRGAGRVPARALHSSEQPPAPHRRGARRDCARPRDPGTLDPYRTSRESRARAPRQSVRGSLPCTRAALAHRDRQRHRVRARKCAHPRSAPGSPDSRRCDQPPELRSESAARRGAAHVVVAVRMDVGPSNGLAPVRSRRLAFLGRRSLRCQRLCLGPVQRCQAPAAGLGREEVARGDGERHGEAEQPEGAGTEPLHHLACGEG